MEAIEKRYSVRNYADREIEPDKIEKILTSLKDYCLALRNSEGFML